MANITAQPESKTRTEPSRPAASPLDQAVKTAQDLTSGLASLVFPNKKPATLPTPSPEYPQASPSLSPSETPAAEKPGSASIGSVFKAGAAWIAAKGSQAREWMAQKYEQFSKVTCFSELCSVCGACAKELIGGLINVTKEAFAGVARTVEKMFSPSSDREAFPITKALLKAAEGVRNRQEERKRRREFFADLRRKRREERDNDCDAHNEVCDVTNIAPRYADTKDVADLKLAILFNKVSTQDMVEARRFLADYEREFHQKKSTES